jgi:hypothetical protein
VWLLSSSEVEFAMVTGAESLVIRDGGCTAGRGEGDGDEGAGAAGVVKEDLQCIISSFLRRFGVGPGFVLSSTLGREREPLSVSRRWWV